MDTGITFAPFKLLTRLSYCTAQSENFSLMDGVGDYTDAMEGGFPKTVRRRTCPSILVSRAPPCAWSRGYRKKSLAVSAKTPSNWIWKSATASPLISPETIVSAPKARWRSSPATPWKAASLMKAKA